MKLWLYSLSWIVGGVILKIYTGQPYSGLGVGLMFLVAMFIYDALEI